METQFTVDYFIKKFEAIPEQLWMIHSIGQKYGPRCANGHCMGDGHSSYTEESAGLFGVFKNLTVHFKGGSVVDNLFSEGGRYSFKADRINNGQTKEYQQSSPKQRILAALHDIKKMQEPQPIPEPVKQITKYVKVAVPDSLTEQSLKLMEVQS